jgi:hypothetical protein
VAQPLYQFGNRNTATGGEFPVALPQIRSATDAGDNPLPDISAKVQHEIADGVCVLTAARPDLLVVEFPEATLDATAGQPQALGGTAQEFLVEGIGHN